MGIFTKEIYVDRPQEWTDVDVGEYKLLDKVIVKGTFDTGGWTYDSEYGREPECVHDPEGIVVDYAGDPHDSYSVILKGGRVLNGVSSKLVKRSYGEFQEEFEAIEQATEEYKNVDELRTKLQEAQQRADELYAKGRRIIEKNHIAIPEMIKKYRG